MEEGDNISQSLHRLDNLCTAGYAIALHISFTTPRFLFQTYSQDWMNIYSEQGLVLKDPTVLWGFSNTGVAHWQDLEDIDDSNVLDMARKFGLKFGFTYATDENDSRSIASFSRSDRRFTDAEVGEISRITDGLHRQTAEITDLSTTELQELRKLSVIFTRG